MAKEKSKRLVFSYLKPFLGQVLANISLRLVSSFATMLLLLCFAPTLSLLFGRLEAEQSEVAAVGVGASGDAGAEVAELAEASGVVGVAGAGGGTAAGDGSAQAVGDASVSWAPGGEFAKAKLAHLVEQFGYSKTLALLALSLFALYFVKNLTAYLALYFFAAIRNKVNAAIRSDVFSKYLTLSLSFHTAHSKGDLLSRISADVKEIDENILKHLQTVLTDFFLFFFLILTLFFLSSQLTISILIILPITAFLTGFSSKTLRKKSLPQRDAQAKLISQIEETASGIKTIRSYTAVDYIKNRFSAQNNFFNKINIGVLRRECLGSPVSEVIGSIAIVSILIYGGHLILGSNSTLSPEAFISYILTLALILTPGKNLSVAYYGIQRGRASEKRIEYILNSKEEIEQKENALKIKEFSSAIEFCNLSFAYGLNQACAGESGGAASGCGLAAGVGGLKPASGSLDGCGLNRMAASGAVVGGSAAACEAASACVSAASAGVAASAPLVLKNINLKIEKSKHIAIVGASGSGKSTLANFISRFYDPSYGSVKIDGIDLRDLDIQSLRSKVAVVTQDSVLFNDSVYNNLLLGNRNAKEEEIYKAVEIAQASDFIQAMPQKFHTCIGDGGDKLSGGEKQRLSIARALLKDAPILVLDEATSALDTKTEANIMQAMREHYCKDSDGKTIISIAHRLSTIATADEIIVLKDGEIIERGLHSELLQQGGEYAKLWSLQSLK